MKIAITGHSKGIGKAIAEHCVSQGHTVKGYSRSNSWDVSTKHKEIIQDAMDCDVFINNAYSGFTQIEIFNELFKLWELQEKTIINMSSQSKYLPMNSYKTLPPEYIMCKKELDKVTKKVMLLHPMRKCRVISICPGFVDTDLLSSYGVDKSTYPVISAQQLAEYVSWVIDAPQHIEIGELGIWCIRSS